MQVDHRALQNVGGGALDRHVHCVTLGGARIWQLRLVRSGTSLRLPNIVLTTPVWPRVVERLVDEARTRESRRSRRR